MILSGRLNKLKIPCPVALIMIINFSKVWKLKLTFGSNNKAAAIQPFSFGNQTTNSNQASSFVSNTNQQTR